MARTTKILFIALGALLVIAVLVVGAVLLLVDPDDYRGVVTDAVGKQTGRELQLAGPLELDFLPCCGLTIDRATLGNPPGFPAEPFVSVESARLGIRLMPLLTRRVVEIGEVKVAGLKANLLVREDGSDNWTFADTAAPAAEEPDAEGAGVQGLSVESIEVVNGLVSYTDEQSDSRYRIDDLNLSTGEFDGSSPFPLTAGFVLTDLSDDTVAEVSLSGQAELPADAPEGTLRALVRTVNGNVDVRGPAMPANDIHLHFTAEEVALDSAETTRVGLTTLVADVEAKAVAGAETATVKLRAPTATVDIADVTQISAPSATADIRLTGGDLPGGAVPIQAKLGPISYDSDAGQGTLESLAANLEVAGLKLDVDGGGRFGAVNDLKGAVRFAPFSPREVLTAFKTDVPDTADPNVLKRVEGTTRWFLGDRFAGLENLAVKFDDSSITGSLSRELLPEGSRGTPLTRFDLAIDELNVDRYLAPEAPEPAKGKSANGTGGTTAGAKKAPPTELPRELLRTLRLDGKARIGSLVYEGIKLRDVNLGTTAADGKLTLDPLAARLYSGSIDGRLGLDATGAKVRADLAQQFTAVDLGALLGDFADMDSIAGRMTARIAGSATGNTDDELLRNLGGNVSFNLKDGLYKGMDLWYEIQRARALIRRTAPPARSGPEQTPIEALEFAGQIANGVLQSDKLLAQIPFLQVTGKLGLDLFEQTIDTELQALVNEKPVFADGTDLGDLQNLRIPLTISGALDSPKVRVDLTRMAKDVATEAVREKVRDKLLDRFGIGGTPEEGTEAAPESGDGTTTAAPDEQPAAEKPAEEKPAEKSEDPVQRALDRLLKKVE